MKKAMRRHVQHWKLIRSVKIQNSSAYILHARIREVATVNTLYMRSLALHTFQFTSFAVFFNWIQVLNCSCRIMLSS